MHDTSVKGVSYVTNQQGRRIAVQLDLEKHRELWEDIYFSLVAKQRLKEPAVSYHAARKRLVKKGKLPR